MLPDPYYSHAGITIYHGDCREILPHLPKVDLVLTDPPYGIDIVKTGCIGASGGKSTVRDYGISDWDAKPISAEVWSLVQGASSDQIVFGFNHFIESGFGSTRCVLVWDKKCQNGWRDNFSDCEIAWASLQEPLRVFRYLWMGASRGTNELDAKVHPTQKPLAVMMWCLSLSPKSQIILDPFMGSGTTLVAAKQLGRKAIGIEIEERYCAIAVKRLAQEMLPFAESEPEPEQMSILGCEEIYDDRSEAERESAEKAEEL